MIEKLGMDCFSTPFDDTAVEFLEGMNVPAHKIASFELVHTELLKKIAATGKPVIMSAGMSTLAEIDEAVRTLREAVCTELQSQLTAPLVKAIFSGEPCGLPTLTESIHQHANFLKTMTGHWNPHMQNKFERLPVT